MATTLLHLSEVHVRRGMQTVLNGQELTVNGGETVVLWGSNGAGNRPCLKPLQVSFRWKKDTYSTAM